MNMIMDQSACNSLYTIFFLKIDKLTFLVILNEKMATMMNFVSSWCVYYCENHIIIIDL